jgi:hypothetical protein
VRDVNDAYTRLKRGAATREKNLPKNTIETETWSNPESEQLYRDHWPHDPGLFERYEEGEQWGGCAFFAPFDGDYGFVLLCQIAPSSGDGV